MRHTVKAIQLLLTPALYALPALALLFAFLVPSAAEACVPASSSTSVTTYEFATDETAAGDLDIEWRDNYDFEADSPYCTITPINGFEDVEGMLVHCELP